MIHLDLQLNFRLVFRESVYDSNPFIEHYCDDYFELKTLPIDRSFRKLCQDIFFHNYHNAFFSMGKLIECYTENKKNLKEQNLELCDSLRGRKKFLYEILESFNCVRFKIIPKAFKVKISGAYFINYDGNTIILLAIGMDKNFYYFFYSGS